MKPVLTRIASLGRDKRGVAAAEYAIMAVGIVIVVGAALMTLTNPNNSAFVVLGNTVSSTQADMIANLPNSR